MDDLIGRIKAEMLDREVFRRVFGGEEGTSVLAWILNDCGYFSLDAERIAPNMTAFCNRLLNRIGIIHASNLFVDTAARMGAANDNDLKNYLAEQVKEKADE
jgi:hypothetical protein